jgi:Spy/CpxP family protein refolding chaperone
MSGRRFMPVLLSLAAGLILVAPYSVQAQGGGASGGRPDPTAIYQQLGASSDQLQKIKELISQFENAQQAKGQAMFALIKDMHAMSLQPSPDESAVIAKQGQINQAGNDMANAKIKVMLAIRGILTPDQKQKLVQLMQQQAQSQQQGGGTQ